jgi:Family of unknown function (DUF6893)
MRPEFYILGVIALLVTVAAIRMAPDLVRYLRIRAM